MKYGDSDIANDVEVFGENLDIEARELGGIRNGSGVQYDNLFVKFFSGLLSSSCCIPAKLFECGIKNCDEEACPIGIDLGPEM